MLGFARLSAAAYGTIARVIDEDGIFRARVAEAAEEADVGRASWLWLHRPVGWRDDPAMAGEGPPPPGRPSDDARREDKAGSARLRKALAEAEAARRRTAEQLAEARRSEAQARAERDELAATLDGLREDRNAAVRRSKEIEAELAVARRDLKLARQATIAAEEELARERAAAPVADPPTAPQAAPAARAPGEADPASFDQAAVASAVEAAAAAAADLAEALGRAATDLAVPPEAPVPAAAPDPPEVRSGHKADKKRKKHRKTSARATPALPPGVFDGTVEAHRALLADPSNLLVVDGYNVARAAWSDVAPEEERRRTVALLDEVQARSGGRVVVVFDGDDAVTAPKTSKHVRVRFSATGQTADDAIVDLVAGTPTTTPVVVVSSDRAVAADARRQGAVPVGARAFLAAAGR